MLGMCGPQDCILTVGTQLALAFPLLRAHTVIKSIFPCLIFAEGEAFVSKGLS